jgi:hypothetical protein
MTEFKGKPSELITVAVIAERAGRSRREVEAVIHRLGLGHSAVADRTRVYHPSTAQQIIRELNPDDAPVGR